MPQRVAAFSPAGRLEAGYLLRLLQQGESLGLPHSRPMPSIGSRCHELRIHDTTGTSRIVYRVDVDATVILDMFMKKTQRTPQSVIDRCKSRLRHYDRQSKRMKLERAGWAIGSVKEFLGLSEADAALIEMKLALSQMLRKRRTQYGLSQTELAKRLQSSQSRVAKMEAGDPSVSMDLLVSALLHLGANSVDLAKAIRGEVGKRGRAA